MTSTIYIPPRNLQPRKTNGFGTQQIVDKTSQFSKQTGNFSAILRTLRTWRVGVLKATKESVYNTQKSGFVLPLHFCFCFLEHNDHDAVAVHPIR